MRRRFFCAALVLLLTCSLQAKKKDKDPTANFPRILLHARYVYVTSMTGNQFDGATAPDDRRAIDRVQEALRKWGQYQIALRPEDADLIFNVRAGRMVGERVGVHVPVGMPPVVIGGTGPLGAPRPGVGATAGTNVGPKDDYLEIVLPSGSAPIWRREQHNGFGIGVPLIQEFRKEADAAAEQDRKTKKKP